MNRFDLLRHALEHSVGTVSISDVVAAEKRAVNAGRLVTSGENDLRINTYTTPELLEAERQYLAVMRAGRGRVAQIADVANVPARASARGLNEPQMRAALAVLGSRDTVTGIQGYAGVGKTASVRLVADCALDAGFAVRGFAPSAGAAQTLGKAAGISSATLASHLVEERRGPRGSVESPADGRRPPSSRKGELWVVDEAGMVSTKQMHSLLFAAERRRLRGQDTRIVLVGDTKQLGAVEAGAPFRLMQERGMAVATIDVILRQRVPPMGHRQPSQRATRAHPNQPLSENLAAHQALAAKFETTKRLRSAVEDVALRDSPEAAVDRLLPDVVEVRDAKKLLQELTDRFVELSEHKNGNVIAVTASNEDRRELNKLIREGLRDSGQITGEELQAEILTKLDRTAAERRQCGKYSVGDIVEFTRGYQRLGTTAGERFRVVGINTNAGTVSLAHASTDRTSQVGSLGRGIKAATILGLVRPLQQAQRPPIEWEPRRASKVEVFRSEPRELAAGDVIRWTRNDRHTSRSNGDFARVVRVDRRSFTATVERGDGSREKLALNHQPHWDYAYASTVHSAQGKTVDNALIHMPMHSRGITGREWFYVAISRARKRAQIFTDDMAALPRAVVKSTAQENALPAVERSSKSEQQPVGRRQLPGRAATSPSHGYGR
jgi:ATP-dependent exoDNAse (exonuclease V) alpha subunit